MNNQIIELDIDKRGCGNNCIRIAQGENGGTTIKALVFDNGGEFSLAGYTAYLVARLPDRIHYYKGTATVSGNAVTHVCEESKLACVPGYTDEAYFEFTNGSQTVQTERFALDIMRDAREGNTPAKSWDNAVEALEKRAETAVTKGEQAVTDAGKALNNANAAVNICKSATDAANIATSKANAATKSAADAASSANTAKANADTATDAAIAATNAANASKDSADLAAADARKAAEEARGSVSSDMKIYFKRVTDAQGNSWPVLVDMTI
ncbi:BppU family phage baseplate upper protein [Collinsella sp. LCP21S3_A9]|uniref:BppU family phage baseplate upper protein n=1 Tax=Collinsella sp. LCP21S3_A9 TaxID=3438770 RepID=UPI003F8E8016